ncbi:MAG: hypothetical protein K6F07_00415 [Bacilli bacterium]|nr:hypothetical protein [Bacilli bacterium]
MKLRKRILFILEILVVLAYIAGGILVIILRRNNARYDGQLLGTVILICGALRVIKFIFNRENVQGNLPLGLIAGIIGISFGFIFIFSELDIMHMCLLWGLYEILFGTIEVVVTLKDMRLDPHEIITDIIAVGEIIFGTLLCIHAHEGIGEHLIFIGATLILTSVNCVVGMLQEHFLNPRKEKKHKKENESDA